MKKTAEEFIRHKAFPLDDKSDAEWEEFKNNHKGTNWVGFAIKAAHEYAEAYHADKMEELSKTYICHDCFGSGKRILGSGKDDYYDCGTCCGTGNIDTNSKRQEEMKEEAVGFVEWLFNNTESSYEALSGEIYYVKDGINFNTNDMYVKYKEETTTK